ncbi:MAG: acetylornithine/succinylornithine family transaminase [Ignavibacteriaceae bacterium]
MNDFLKEEEKLFLRTYKRIPINISHGDGVHLIAKDGTRYLDFIGGLGVNALGHAHPRIAEAIIKQTNKFSHLSNYFITDVQLEFTAKLLKYSNMSKAFLTNSGAEAVEAAIKAIRRSKGSEGEIFSLTNSFHGRTYGALSLTDRKDYKTGFEPLLPKISTIIFNDTEDLQKNINEKTAAVFIEFLQGESGINLISTQFIKLLAEIKQKYNFAIVADCIQSGVGRTGKPFAFNHFEIMPDIVLIAKSIGGGLPLGAMLTKGEFDESFLYGSHGTTFGGNPVSCAAGLIVLKEVFENGLMKNASELGNYLKNELEELKKLFPDKMKDIRGLGFMIGVEMYDNCTLLVEKLMQKNVLANSTNKNVLRLLPPLITTKNNVDFFLYNFHEVLKKI